MDLHGDFVVWVYVENGRRHWGNPRENQHGWQSDGDDSDSESDDTRYSSLPQID
jgi:hypothetical protein